FGGPDFLEKPKSIQELVMSYPQSYLIGCSTAGEIFGIEVIDNSLVVAVIQFEQTTIDTAVISITAPESSYQTGNALAKRLLRPDLRGLMILSDGIQVNGSELVRGLNSILPESVVVTGGLAGDGNRFKQTWIINNGKFYTSAVSAVGFYGEALSIGYGMGAGWNIFGPERVVTHSQGNILYQLDGKPALQLYKEYLGNLSAGLPATGLLFPLALRTNTTDENRLVRTILGINEEQQSVIFAGDIPQGALAQLMTANFDHLIQGAAGAARIASEKINPVHQSLCIAISCVGRRLLLKDRIEEETEAIIEIMPPFTKQIGFYSYGELSPYEVGYCDLHNQTMTLTIISESVSLTASATTAKTDLATAEISTIEEITAPPGTTIHPLLKRQLKKVGISESLTAPTSEAWLKLIKRIGESYEETEQKRELLERSLNLCSTEMQTLYKSLAEKVEQLNRKNEELIQRNEELIESYKKANQIFSALAEALPGKILDGKYRLDTKIGAGGYGAVYRATHLLLNHSVAVKVFLPIEGNNTTESLERFRLEGISACRVHHPNAVSVLDSGISNEGIAYLVMELLEGRTLNYELKEKGSLSLNRCAEIIIPVCNALSKAHEAGIVHRDIKPDNIFLHQTKEGEIVKVVDFGIAKFMDTSSEFALTNLQTMDGVVGTPTYMSPERLNNKPYDGKSDVYSIGIVIYEILCGRVPFDPSISGIGKVIAMHLNAKPKSLRAHKADIPEAVESIVMQALSKNPDHRPTAKELAQEFANVLENLAKANSAQSL
ncbi:MAG: FIST N-terminal domain-containing protein, partial [Acidobacteriota bacterium]